MNETEPDAVDGETVATRVTGCPKTGAPGETLVRAVVVAVCPSSAAPASRYKTTTAVRGIWLPLNG